jgi:transposase
MEQRALIKFCIKLKTAATETFEMLKRVYSEECSSRTSVFEWRKRFKEGRESLRDERKGRPSTSRREKSTEVIQKCLAKDGTLSLRMLEEMTGINRETVRKILVEDLKKRKMCAHFVSHFLKPDQKPQCTASSVEFVEMIDDDRTVLKSIVTADDSWCFMYDPEANRQSASWLSPKKPKAQKSRM